MEAGLPITTVTARSFNQDISKARKAAAAGPVIITERGKPVQVLMNIADYERLSGHKTSIIDLLAMRVGGDIEFSTQPSHDLARPAEFG